ncbi:hypothetical protein DOTSEDRAFT_19395 [Dothistroma septosporum NZE10]|uniref:Uncharacterized protein n=1 Tax=Dothistroma septosporum (strain NZE10 / CBS 128990) TaxID=675120 RepID=N1Q334_DOTSN|nr:hypothetical protein DOTSEDRAFT_19395 [Dothistroma septosporum NZE10]
MREPLLAVGLAASLYTSVQAQQFSGNVIPNSLSSVPGSETSYFRISNGSEKKNNLTLINCYSYGQNNQRIVASNVRRAVIMIHGLNSDPATYMSNMRSALAQVNSEPNVNFDNVALMAPFLPSGDDKTTGYSWTNGLATGQGSTGSALIQKGSQWSAGGNHQYPDSSKTTSPYTVLYRIIQYFHNAALFPKLTQIVISGHSLGAQTVQRYAPIGSQLNTWTPQSYWLANPDSHVWLSTDRPLSTACCSIFDDYRRGFDKFTDYPMTYARTLVASGRAAISAYCNSKAINYVRVIQDLSDDSSTCAPETTGKDRNERLIKTRPFSRDARSRQVVVAIHSTS